MWYRGNMKKMKNKGLEKLKEIKGLLSKKPPKKFLCATSGIQYYDYLGENCLKKYEELPIVFRYNNEQSGVLFKYLHETLTKL